MHPFTVVLGIVMGSLVSIAFGLGVVALVFFILQGDHPRLAAEWPTLLRSTVLFCALAGLSAAGFFGTLRARPWRYPVLAMLWAGLIATGWMYWPD